MLILNYYNKLNILKKILENGFNLNTVDKEKWTPLHLAIQEAHLDIVIWLCCQNSVDITLRTNLFCEDGFYIDRTVKGMAIKNMFRYALTFKFTKINKEFKIYKIMNVGLKSIIKDKSRIEIEAQKLNFNKAKKDLKWNPKISIDGLISEMIEAKIAEK